MQHSLCKYTCLVYVIMASMPPSEYFLRIHVCPTHPGLDSFSEWLRSRSASADYKSSPSSSPSSSSTPPSAPAVSQTRDRLLHSEIRELQVKLAQLEKENHELRQLLKASGDDSRAALLGRQVFHPLKMYMYMY